MLTKQSDRVYFLPGEEFTDRPFLYYFKGDEYSFAVDAGNSRKHVEKFYRELQAMGLPEPTFTGITHWHWDHTFGMHAVSGTTIASSLTNRKLNEVKQWVWTVEEMDERERRGEDIAFCNEHILREYKNLKEIIVKPAAMEVDKHMEINLGGIHCVIDQHDSPHCRDALFIYLPEEKILAVGDACCEDYYDNNRRYDKTRLADLIEYIDSYDFTTCLSGHDVPQNKNEIMQQLRTKLAKLQEPADGI